MQEEGPNLFFSQARSLRSPSEDLIQPPKKQSVPTGIGSHRYQACLVNEPTEVLAPLAS